MLSECLAPFEAIGEMWRETLIPSPQKREKLPTSEKAVLRVVRSAQRLVAEIRENYAVAERSVQSSPSFQCRYLSRTSRHCCYDSFFHWPTVRIVTPEQAEKEFRNFIGALAGAVSAIALYLLTQDCLAVTRLNKQIDKLSVSRDILYANNSCEAVQKLADQQIRLLSAIRRGYALGGVLKTSLVGFSALLAYKAIMGGAMAFGAMGLIATATVYLIKHARDSFEGEREGRKMLKSADSLESAVKCINETDTSKCGSRQ